MLNSIISWLVFCPLAVSVAFFNCLNARAEISSEDGPPIIDVGMGSQIQLPFNGKAPMALVLVRGNLNFNLNGKNTGYGDNKTPGRFDADPDAGPMGNYGILSPSEFIIGISMKNLEGKLDYMDVQLSIFSLQAFGGDVNGGVTILGADFQRRDDMKLKSAIGITPVAFWLNAHQKISSPSEEKLIWFLNGILTLTGIALTKDIAVSGDNNRHLLGKGSGGSEFDPGDPSGWSSWLKLETGLEYAGFLRIVLRQGLHYFAGPLADVSITDGTKNIIDRKGGQSVLSDTELRLELGYKWIKAFASAGLSAFYYKRGCTEDRKSPQCEGLSKRWIFTMGVAGEY